MKKAYVEFKTVKACECGKYSENHFLGSIPNGENLNGLNLQCERCEDDLLIEVNIRYIEFIED